MQLEQLRSVAPDVKAAAVVGPDGEIEQISADGALGDVLGPILTTFATMAERTTQELGRGGFTQVVLEGTMGLVVARDLGGGRMLAALTSPNARLGLLLDDVRACAEGLRTAEVARV